MLSHSIVRITLPIVLLMSVVCLIASEAEATLVEPVAKNDRPRISRIQPSQYGGQAFQIVYRVPVPIQVYWRFKTDFNGDFQTSNKYIRSHRLVAQSANVAITENKYANAPDVYFQWKTTVTASDFHLAYVLLNPKSCGQKFQFGRIEAAPDGPFTRVVHRIYFDFFGAFFWAHLPGPGGMRDFLRYTARWEQMTVLRLKKRYGRPGSEAAR